MDKGKQQPIVRRAAQRMTPKALRRRMIRADNYLISGETDMLPAQRREVRDTATSAIVMLPRTRRQQQLRLAPRMQRQLLPIRTAFRVLVLFAQW
jgi:hypothetical protein